MLILETIFVELNILRDSDSLIRSSPQFVVFCLRVYPMSMASVARPSSLDCLLWRFSSQQRQMKPGCGINLVSVQTETQVVEKVCGKVEIQTVEEKERKNCRTEILRGAGVACTKVPNFTQASSAFRYLYNLSS